MLVDVKQSELDLAEERLLTAVFGSTDISTGAQWMLKFLNIDINNYIQNFESMMKPLMLDNGKVDAALMKSIVSAKYPVLSNIIPASDFRLVEVVDELTKLLKGVER